jgi:cytoskeleton protein RodZ
MTEKTSDQQSDEESSFIRVGRQLREERIRQGLSVSDVSKHLHLSGMLVGDLESGRLDRLAALYRRGYVRNYAGLLGLDPQALLAELQAEEPPQLREVLPGSQRARKLDHYLKVATYLLVTTVIVPPLIFIYVQSGSRMVERDPVALSEPVETSDAASSSEQRIARRIARALALEEPAAGEQSTQASHVAASALPLAPPRPLREVEAAPSGTEPGIVADDDAQPSLEVNLVARLLEDSWVEISDANGTRLEYDLLRAGHERHYRGLPPFRILLGRASAVELLLDGQLLEYAGHDRGGVVQLELQASGEVLR